MRELEPNPLGYDSSIRYIGLETNRSLLNKEGQLAYLDTNEVVIGIGDRNLTPPILFFRRPNDKCFYAYSPNGFADFGKSNFFRRLMNFGSKHFIRIERDLEIGKRGLYPLCKIDGRVDNQISDFHFKIGLEEGRLYVENRSSQATRVVNAYFLNDGLNNIIYLRGGAVFFNIDDDYYIQREFDLQVGENNLSLVIGSGKLKIIYNNGREVNPQRIIDDKRFLVLCLGKEGIDEKDETISKRHLSLIYDKMGRIFYIFDHSTNGTRISNKNQYNIREREKAKPRTPILICKKIGHQDQQIPNDKNSVGGDYYLFGREVVISQGEYLLEKGGDAVVLMDTATMQTTGETPATTTRPFARTFLTEYYNQIQQGKDPQEAMRAAYEITYEKYDLGRKTEATFTFVTVVGGVAYSLWVGNTEAVVVRKGEEIVKLADKKGMVFESYLDPKTGYTVSPTILVASGKDKIREQLFVLQPGDKIYVFTDGVKQLNPKNPRASSLNRDDAVIVEL